MISLVKKVRELPAEEGGGITAAALTAYASGPDRERAISAGFEEHMGKPFSADELLKIINRLAIKAA